VAGGDEAAQSRGPFRRQLAAGTWVGSLVCVPFLLALIYLAVRAGQHHGWGMLAGYIGIVLVFLSIPAGGMKRLGQVVRRRKPPNRQPG